MHDVMRGCGCWRRRRGPSRPRPGLTEELLVGIWDDVAAYDETGAVL